jgi:putative transposase
LANTYTQIHIQFVFAVKFRNSQIQSEWKDELFKYITGVVKNNKHQLLSINGMPDHLHILIGLRPTQSISDLMQDVKGNSSKWINNRKLTKTKFEWQEGYGAFSYGKSQLNRVKLYIQNQELHHKKKTFKEEYIEFLEKFEVEYDEKYIFRDLI